MTTFGMQAEKWGVDGGTESGKVGGCFVMPNDAGSLYYITHGTILTVKVLPKLSGD